MAAATAARSGSGGASGAAGVTLAADVGAAARLAARSGEKNTRNATPPRSTMLAKAPSPIASDRLRDGRG
jgi:hypothetical protein